MTLLGSALNVSGVRRLPSPTSDHVFVSLHLQPPLVWPVKLCQSPYVSAIRWLAYFSIFGD